MFRDLSPMMRIVLIIIFVVGLSVVPMLPGIIVTLPGGQSLGGAMAYYMAGTFICLIFAGYLEILRRRHGIHHYVSAADILTQATRETPQTKIHHVAAAPEQYNAIQKLAKAKFYLATHTTLGDALRVHNKQNPSVYAEFTVVVDEKVLLQEFDLSLGQTIKNQVCVKRKMDASND